MFLLLILSVIFLVIVIILVVRTAILFFINKKKDIQYISALAGSFVALATAIFSIYSSGESLRQSEKLSRNALEQAENLSIIQARPFIGVEKIKLEFDDQIQGDKKHCYIIISLVNYGNSPAKLDKLVVNMSFLSRDEGMIKLSSKPDSQNVSKINLNTEALIIGPGATSHKFTIELWSKKENIDLIKQRLVPINFNMVLPYSAVGLKKKWSYKIDGKIIAGLDPTVFREELTEENS
ncbi:MAG: hypothetical protein NT014_07325 [Candidatus Omnitrophica bacterium]|nr:hypothetical protein [Candidatus Omnitrophota bacterium]